MAYRPQFIITIIATFLIAGAVLGYAYLKTRDYLAGPQITIISPLSGSSVSNPLIEVVGTAKNISFISLNDRPIVTDDKGNFKEKLLLFPGYNIMSVKAEDRYKRSVEQRIEVIFKSAEEGLSPE